MVAGVLANFLALNPPAFDMSTGQVAHNARKFLVDTANWQCNPGVKSIRNGVSEDNNPKNVAAATPPSAAPAPVSAEKNECHGVSGNLWVEDRNLAVQNAGEFCKQSLKSFE